MKKVTKIDLKEMLGIDSELSAFQKLENLDLRYEKLAGEERDSAILECIKRIQTDTQIVGTPERTKVWENGWNENLELFCKDFDTDTLKPKYFHSGLPIRYKGDLIKSDIDSFQVELDLLVKRCLFEEYAAPYNNIYEFGCGTGYNLAMLSEMYPHKSLYGMDFVDSAVRIVGLLHEKKQINVKGYKFDFTSPDSSLNIENNSAVFTFAALEQVGDRFKPFIDYLIKSDANVCVHMEPIVELYNQDNLLDYLAASFHKKRHYLNGLYPYLKKMEDSSLIEILKVQRLHLGNHNHESYTLIVWRPKK